MRARVGRDEFCECFHETFSDNGPGFSTLLWWVWKSSVLTSTVGVEGLYSDFHSGSGPEAVNIPGLPQLMFLLLHLLLQLPLLPLYFKSQYHILVEGTCLAWCVCGGGHF